MMKAYIFAATLLCLIRSTAFVQESMCVTPNGVVEEWMATENRSVEVASESSVNAMAGSEGDTSAPVKGVCVEHDSYSNSDKRWFFTFKPGYFYLTDSDMRQFYNDGGFTFRAEAGCRFWGPLIVWVDGGYFQKEGKAIGGTEKLELKVATITLGLKLFYQFNRWIAAYAGAGPRLFLMMQHNDYDHVRGDDNEIGIGGGFDGGFLFFPVPQWPNVYLDLFGDYSLKKMPVEEDEISSYDYDMNLSGFTGGLGLGVRF
ncbi:MAG: hypothetical protein WCF19_03110 [Chlamydiales bacterium]